MSQRRKLKHRMRQLHEIRNIMDAMKNLAVLETHKLDKLLVNQTALIEDLDKIAEDFLGYYPYPFSRDVKAIDCWILFGSERGFNGDFNDSLIEYLDRHLESINNTNYLLIPIGNKLFSRLQGNTHVSDFIDGPDVAEEVNSILNTLLTHINDLQSQYPELNIFALYHDAESDEVTSRQLMPPFINKSSKQPTYPFPPLLNLSPEDYFSELLDRYLFVTLQEIIYNSLMAENHKRIQHMDGAVQKLDEKTGELARQYHIHRQEEITEEIEVILLNSPVEPGNTNPNDSRQS